VNVVTRFRNTLGLPGHLAVRLQPNHPTDAPAGIAASILDGLMYGAGDAVIGINPAATACRPWCDLLHLLDELIPAPPHAHAELRADPRHQHICRRSKSGAPVDLVFQSIGGTEATNTSFGLNLALLDEAHAAALALRRGTVGDNCMYFETGQGSALSANAHHGVDQQTLEARAYAVARRFGRCWSTPWSASSGPSTWPTASRSSAPGWKTTSAASCWACRWAATSATPTMPRPTSDDMDTLLVLLATAGLNFMMGVPGADDVMLNYQSTSFHDALYVRSCWACSARREFEAWLQRVSARACASPRRGARGAGPGRAGHRHRRELARTGHAHPRTQRRPRPQPLPAAARPGAPA
jgi:ethanolamine ammonia-lyase large subunit